MKTLREILDTRPDHANYFFCLVSSEEGKKGEFGLFLFIDPQIPRIITCAVVYTTEQALELMDEAIREYRLEDKIETALDLSAFVSRSEVPQASPPQIIPGDAGEFLGLTYLNFCEEEDRFLFLLYRSGGYTRTNLKPWFYSKPAEAAPSSYILIGDGRLYVFEGQAAFNWVLTQMGSPHAYNAKGRDGSKKYRFSSKPLQEDLLVIDPPAGEWLGDILFVVHDFAPVVEANPSPPHRRS